MPLLVVVQGPDCAGGRHFLPGLPQAVNIEWYECYIDGTCDRESNYTTCTANDITYLICSGFAVKLSHEQEMCDTISWVFFLSFFFFFFLEKRGKKEKAHKFG